MTKKDLEKFLKEYLKRSSNKQEKALLKQICYDWLPIVRNKQESKM